MRKGQGSITKLGTDLADSKGAKERFYDKIPLSKKQLDIIIVVLIAAIIILIVVGAMNAETIF